MIVQKNVMKVRNLNIPQKLIVFEDSIEDRTILLNERSATMRETIFETT
jgi:hypothetical protein